MIKWLLHPVTVDGILWVSIALFGCMQSMLTNDDAYKYVDARTLFWMKFLTACAGASAGSLKAFRSTTYAQHKDGEEKPAVVTNVETVTATPDPEKPPVATP